ncbi:MAG: 3-carboxy-cis,cis-muconate cycloisomerase [Rhodospirillales bacterium]|nr:3-carboxy-cis,cis-muconate cycloisomerase [Rhodospirillales bacterium]
MTVWQAPSLGVAAGLLADEALNALFTPDAELEAMLAFERALAKAEQAAGNLSEESLRAVLAACCPDFLDRTALAEGFYRDGVVVPALVRQLRATIVEPHAQYLHRGATSQDVIDSGLMLRLKPAVAILEDRLSALILEFETFAAASGRQRVMARTRFRDALPFTLADRVETWVAPLRELRAETPSVFPLQLGGPIGLRAEAFGPLHAAIAETLSQELGLCLWERAWHGDRRPLWAIAQWCAALTTALGKVGIDVALMAQTAVGEIRTPGGGSSAMPHKSNPVGAERLVTLSRYVSGQAALLQTAALHENERSGIAWSLEWLVLPPLIVGCGAATLSAAQLLAGLQPGDGSGA